jgi:3-dehydroquinate synthase
VSVETLSSEALRIRSGQGDYDVVPIATADALREKLFSLTDPFFAIDQRVADLYPAVLAGASSGRVHRFPATEEEKTLQGVERLCRAMQDGGVSKKSTLVVIGGGIAQDLGAFAAHIYFRGISLVLVPTTLLSMADSCIGAKTGLNLGESKNQIGFFQSPSAVFVWIGFLKTLTPIDLRCGFGEIVKLSITAGEDAFNTVSARIDAQGFSVAPDISSLILGALRTKQPIIEEDEYELSLRKILNYGHTFGHALEGLTHHEVPHGLAVAWGLDVANYTAMRLGMVDASMYVRVHSFLRRHFAVRLQSRVTAVDLLRLMRRDKKASASGVNLVLPRAFGKLQLTSHAVDEELESILRDYLANENLFSTL